MDPTNQQAQTNQPIMQEPMGMPSYSTPGFRFSKKLVILTAGVVVILLVLAGIFLFLPKSGQKEQNVPVHTKQAPTITLYQTNQIPSPSISADLQKAIDEAKNSASEYDTWQETNLTAYPWMRKFPLATEKYYVYFDINKKVFVGRLYPKQGDSVDQIKAAVLQEFASKGIPTDKYSFEWSTNPK